MLFSFFLGELEWTLVEMHGMNSNGYPSILVEVKGLISLWLHEKEAMFGLNFDHAQRTGAIGLGSGIGSGMGGGTACAATLAPTPS
ncbi:hypothetical protein Tco_0392840 [Tanacetum coccineum]